MSNKSSNNGSHGVGELEATFADCGYVFRHNEDCRVEHMRWQAGREVLDVVELSDGSGLFVECFELLE